MTSIVVRELSLALYSVKNYNSIGVEPAHGVNLLEKYYFESGARLVLPWITYYPPLVDVKINDFIEALEEDKELKKFITISTRNICID